MNDKKYKWRVYSFGTPERVEIERETDSFVWIKGRRNSKKTEWEKYFDTLDEAKAWKLKEADTDIKRATQRLEYAIKDKEELLKELEKWDTLKID